MDYEKKYNEALEKARKRVATEPQDHTDAILKDIFPELRESEDERIRKALVDMVKRETGFTGFPSQGQVLAYLEKQKEPLPIPDKFSGLNSLLLQYFQSAVYRNDDTEIESDTDLWGRKILDYVWKHDEKQKEQKPEWSKEDEEMRNALWNLLKIQYPQDYYMTGAGIKAGKFRDWLKALRPSWKPSEEQMEALEHALISCEEEWAYQDDELRSLLDDLKKL